MIADDDPSISDLISSSVDDTHLHQNIPNSGIHSLDSTSDHSWIVAIAEFDGQPHLDRLNKSYLLLGISISSLTLKRDFIEQDSMGLKLMAALDLLNVSYVIIRIVFVVVIIFFFLSFVLAYRISSRPAKFI